MSLDKAIEHGKEHRKPYYRSGAIDITCRPHGGKGKKRDHVACPWCTGNRLHKHKRAEPVIDDDDLIYRLDEAMRNFMFGIVSGPVDLEYWGET